MIRDKTFTTIVFILTSIELSLTGNITSALPLPNAPNTGTPKGNSTPGTTRNPESFCLTTSKPLTALVANNGKDYTIASHPNFWFYIPYSSNSVRSLEFLLLDGSESKTIYKTKVQLEEKSGIIKISLPPETKYALKVDRQYRWYLLLDCKQNTTPEPDLVLDGWIERIAPTAELITQLQTNDYPSYRAYENNQIWHDAIDSLAMAYCISPERQDLRSAWAKLWQNLNYQWLISETFTNIRHDTELDRQEIKERIKEISLVRLQN